MCWTDFLARLSSPWKPAVLINRYTPPEDLRKGFTVIQYEVLPEKSLKSLTAVPGSPEGPFSPAKPGGPCAPVSPVRPTGPWSPRGPRSPSLPAAPGGPGGPVIPCEKMTESFILLMVANPGESCWGSREEDANSWKQQNDILAIPGPCWGSVTFPLMERGNSLSSSSQGCEKVTNCVRGCGICLWEEMLCYRAPGILEWELWRVRWVGPKWMGLWVWEDSAHFFLKKTNTGILFIIEESDMLSTRLN